MELCPRSLRTRSLARRRFTGYRILQNGKQIKITLEDVYNYHCKCLIGPSSFSCQSQLPELPIQIRSLSFQTIQLFRLSSFSSQVGHSIRPAVRLWKLTKDHYVVLILLYFIFRTRSCRERERERERGRELSLIHI